ncbi:hypothetical protein [Kribbella deserti]|uniref:Uncharacterized protein n=1 Tax=Kribbella deserti TaxID=1926257 RepID=A0ABV6QLJ4_9ACTN
MKLSSFADLLAARGLQLLPGSAAVPVELLVRLPDRTVAHFTARGTTLRLRLFAEHALAHVVIAPECGCADHHPQIGPDRLVVGAHAIPLAEREINGKLAFGWHHHEAGLLRLADAIPHFFTLLAAPQPAPAAPAADTRTLVSIG